jgi:hypothetical protein
MLCFLVVWGLACFPCTVARIAWVTMFGVGCVEVGAIAVGWALVGGSVVGYATVVPRGPIVLASCPCVVVAILVCGCPFVDGPMGGHLKKFTFSVLLPLHITLCLHVNIMSGGFSTLATLCRPCHLFQSDDVGLGST